MAVIKNLHQPFFLWLHQGLLKLSHQYFHLFFFLFRPEPTNQTMVLYVPTTDMGFTIEADKMIHQSVATLAHTDNYKLPPR